MCGFSNAGEQGTAKFRNINLCGVIYLTNYRNAQNYQKLHKNKYKYE